VSEVIGEFFVAGRCRTKGSLKPIVSRGRGGKIVVNLAEQGEYSKPWKLHMIREIMRQCGASKYKPGHAGAVEVRAEFLFERETGADGKIKPSSDTPWPSSIVWGDVDKLERNLLDALTQSGLIEDDRLVVAIQSRKRWVADATETAGVRCIVTALGDAA
jgi:Holliday junction resolvase RusA-like endonuclease